MKKFLIVGGGLAGSTLAHRLLAGNHKVTVVDSGVNHSSAIAAGQVNPMVFRRMTKSWRLDECLESALPFYNEIQKSCQEEMISDLPIRRMFAHEQEKELWEEKSKEEAFSKYLNPITEEDLNFNQAINICGSGKISSSFVVRPLPFLKTIKHLIADHPNGTWLQETIDYTDFDPSNKSWKGQAFDYIVFCEGYRNRENPFFSHLPINATKGQVLKIKSTELMSNEALNRKCFVIPIEENIFRVGSTYEWNETEVNITEEARTRIVENLDSLIDVPYEIVDQVAGIRPTTGDRRPVLGEHKEHKGFFIFNGLGTKGYMLAPLLSQEMMDHILNDKPLHPELALQRFKEKQLPR